MKAATAIQHLRQQAVLVASLQSLVWALAGGMIRPWLRIGSSEATFFSLMKPSRDVRGLESSGVPLLPLERLAARFVALFRICVQPC